MVDFADYITKKSYDTVKSKSMGKAGSAAGGVENIFSKLVDKMIYGDSNVEPMVKKGKIQQIRDITYVMSHSLILL